MKVWKFELQPGTNPLHLPQDTTVLSVIEQNGAVMLYAAVDFEGDPMEVERQFYVAMTGEEFDVGFPAKAEFIGTVRAPGNFVAHVFEKEDVEAVFDGDGGTSEEATAVVADAWPGEKS